MDWKALRTALASEIRSGDRPAGSELPPQAMLARDFGVSRHVVRRALAALLADGLIESRQGAPAVVAMTHVELPVSTRTRFSAAMLQLGLRGQAELLSQRRRLPPTDIARHLGLPRIGPVEVVEILRRIGDRPVSLSRHYFSPRSVPRLPTLTREDPGVTAALRAVGITDFLRSDTLVASRLPTLQESLVLGIGRHTPLIAATGCNTLPDGTPIEVSDSVFPSDSVTLVFRFAG